MSTEGRAQDALDALLWGYKDGKGQFCAGLLHTRMEHEDVGNLIDEILDCVRPILTSSRKGGYPPPVPAAQGFRDGKTQVEPILKAPKKDKGRR